MASVVVVHNDSHCKAGSDIGSRLQRLWRRRPRQVEQRQQQGLNALVLELAVRIVEHLEAGERGPARLVSRTWRDAVRLATRELALSATLRTDLLKERFPNLAALRLRRMTLTPRDMLCLGSLSSLTSLHLSECWLQHGASVLALRGLQALCELELVDIMGPSAEALDDAITALPNLQRLHVESRSMASKAPALRSLAFLPRIKQLSVKQRLPRQSLEGLAHLSSLSELQLLELRGAELTNAVVAALAALSQLMQLRIPGATRVTGFGFRALEDLTSLQELDLSCSVRGPGDEGLTDEGVSSLAALDQLTHLSLAGRAGVTADGLRPFLGSFGQLQHLDLTRTRLGSGDPATFLWSLTQLTTLRLGASGMHASHFQGLSSLRRLQELDVAATPFDSSSCAQLAGASTLRTLRASYTGVTNEGLKHLAGCTQLETLMLEGCQVSMLGMLGTLRCHPGIVLWGSNRATLGRAVNMAHTLLVAVPAPGSRCLRVSLAPESSAALTAAVSLGAAAFILLYLLLLLLTLAWIFLVPLAGLFVAVAFVGCALAGRRLRLDRVVAAWEGILVTLLLGMHCTQLPIAPLPDAEP